MAPAAARGRGHQLTGSTGYFLELGSGGTPADASPARPGVHFMLADEGSHLRSGILPVGVVVVSRA